MQTVVRGVTEQMVPRLSCVLRSDSDPRGTATEEEVVVAMDMEKSMTYVSLEMGNAMPLSAVRSREIEQQLY
jgi:hypothetical protein